jgi:hypothetical protein
MTTSARPVNPFYTACLQRVATRQPLVDLPRFLLGQITFSGTATLRLRTEEVLTALSRHGRGDWGDLLPEDALANELALEQGGRLFSAYGLGRERFWVITAADRSQTTVLLPEDL